MAFRLVRTAGSVQDPAVVNLPASGTIWANSVVQYDVGTAGNVSAALSSSTSSSIIGVALDYVQGASDTSTRVILFVPGQLWEADCSNTAATSNVLLRHQLADSLLVRNITSVSETATTGVFQALAMTGLTTGSGKLIGRFLTHDPRRGGAYDIL